MGGPPGTVREVAALFLKLGLTAFGGPAAHAAAALALLLMTRLNSAWIVLAGGVAGALLFR